MRHFKSSEGDLRLLYVCYVDGERYTVQSQHSTIRDYVFEKWMENFSLNPHGG